MYTADDVRSRDQDDLDERIQYAVENYRSGNGTHMRFYIEDPWRYDLKEELELRGFKNVYVPDIVLKGDAYFEW